MPSTHHVAWWNLENLFDQENAPADRRSDKVRQAIRYDTAGWTPLLRDRKVPAYVQRSFVDRNKRGRVGIPNSSFYLMSAASSSSTTSSEKSPIIGI